jgi:hypothetical protein
MESIAARPETVLELIRAVRVLVADGRELTAEAIAGVTDPERLAAALVIIGEGLLEAALALRAKETDAAVLLAARLVGRAEGELAGRAEGWREGWREGLAAAAHRPRRGHHHLALAAAG